MKNMWWLVAILATAAIVNAASMEMTSARLYKQQGEYEKALQYYDTEISKNPTNAEAYSERGQMLGEIAMSPAKADLAKKVAGSATNPQRSLIERMLADFEKARTNADEKTKKKLNKQIDDILTTTWRTFYSNAVHEDSAKAYDKALDQVDLAILVVPGNWQSYGLKAELLDKTDKGEEAVAVWETTYDRIRKSEFSKEDPKKYENAVGIIESHLLESYYNSHRLPKTIQLADSILKRYPDDANATQFKAFALAEMASDTSRPRKERDSLRTVALGFLNTAHKNRPDYPLLVSTIANFQLLGGDTAAAIKTYDEYLAMKLDSSERHEGKFILGVLYLEGGSFVNTEKARDLFKSLTDEFPDDAAAWNAYGVALIRLGDNAAGKKAFEKSKSLEGK